MWGYITVLSNTIKEDVATARGDGEEIIGCITAASNDTAAALNFGVKQTMLCPDAAFLATQGSDRRKPGFKFKVQYGGEHCLI